MNFTWAQLGEGFDGDYNPNDPTDVEFLRLDLTGPDSEAIDSYCTRVPVSTPEVERLRLLGVASEAYGAGISLKVLSWMEPGWSFADARRMKEMIYGF